MESLDIIIKCQYACRRAYPTNTLANLDQENQKRAKNSNGRLH